MVIVIGIVGIVTAVAMMVGRVIAIVILRAYP